MSRKAIARSPDLQRLREEGYDIDVRGGYLLVKAVPYVTSQRLVERGTLVMALTLAADKTVAPDTHVAYFAGEYPCRQDARPIEHLRNNSARQTLAPGVEVDHTFSAKPMPSRCYSDYHAKVEAYVAILSGPAAALDATATAKTHPTLIPEPDEESVFRYIDTASSRAEIGAVSAKLTAGRIAIVGVGGSGSYVLDLMAKTPVREIHLYDGDTFYQHNAFRAPGAASIADLDGQQKKVHYFRDIYDRMRTGIEAHPITIDSSNTQVLDGMDFVFLCMDGGPDKKAIIEALERNGKAFVDVGMGVLLTDDMLGGQVRITTGTSSRREHLLRRISFAEPGEGNEYDRNIQIADLNALSAALAVIKWKKLRGFYRDLGVEHNTIYTTDVNTLLNDELQCDD